jgi:hypothetical protein
MFVLMVFSAPRIYATPQTQVMFVVMVFSAPRIYATPQTQVMFVVMFSAPRITESHKPR